MVAQDHPTILKVRAQAAARAEGGDAPLDPAWLRRLCLDHGADDVGFVGIDRREVADQRPDILSTFSGTRALISVVKRMNREPVRSPVRSVANHEFHETYQDINVAARDIVRALEAQGIPAVNAVAAFPMEAQGFPGKTWTVAHKPIAEAAGVGKMGIHRNVIHPKFGNFIILDTILVGREIGEESQPLDYAPCLECKLCVAACPVEAIGPDGSFNFSACYTHNYREFLGNFVDWTTTIADAKDGADYRARMSDGETVSMWQSLSFKPSYKAAYCISVCPAGEDVIGPYLDDRIAFSRQVVGPLQAKAETIFVLPDSDAETTVPKRYPHKPVKRVDWTIGSNDPFSFLFNLTLTFQRRKAKGLDATYHLRLSGAMPVEATISVSKQTLAVEFGLLGDADVVIAADSDVWLHALDHDFDLAAALDDGEIDIEGRRDLFETLMRCFPAYGFGAAD